MEINLNDKSFSPSKEFLDLFKKEVAKIPEELIFYRYLGPSFRIGGVVLSPFRAEKTPSFGVFNDEEGRLIFNDLGDSNYSGTAFDFIYRYYREVLNLYLIQDMMKTLNKDFSDFNVNIKKRSTIIYNKVTSKSLKVANYNKNKEFKLEVKIREFRLLDEKYWETYGIKLETLSKFNVFAISHYFINGKGFKADRLAYVYIESKDQQVTLKIYQPFNRKMKWIANVNFSIHQGYRNLPGTGGLLLITKSLKDVMALHDQMKIHSIGVQGEKARMKLSVIEEYKRRFDIVLTLFDQDKEGRNLANYFKEHYDIDFILIPEILKAKDFSDLIKSYGAENSITTLNNLIYNKVNGNGSG